MVDKPVAIQEAEALYSVLVEKDVDVPMRDGVRLKADIFRPQHTSKFPSHPQSRSVPEGQALARAGDTGRKAE